MICGTAPDDRVAMTFAERNTWVSVFVMPAAAITYFAVVFSRLRDTPAAEVAWAGPMLWTIGGTIVATIVVTILVSIVAGMLNRGVLESAEDVRDKQINRYGERLSQGITAVGTGVVLVLLMLELDHFWIANALFFVGCVGATWGAIAKLRAYHGTFHG